jgi:agmatinase
MSLLERKDLSLYSNGFGFCRFPLDFHPHLGKSDVVITGIPFDMATTGRSGAREGPASIRKISTHLTWEERKFPHMFALGDQLKIVDSGDLIFEPGDCESMIKSLTNHSEMMLEAGKKMLSFGGDHFVTLPLLRAHHKKFGMMALIHFDAHTDTYSFGSKYDHGTMFYHAPKEGLIDPAHSIQIGIRTEYDYETHPFQVLDAPYVNETSSTEIVDQIKKRVGDLPIYLTVDIDGLDPAFAPGTGTPVCGGLSTDKVFSILRKLSGLNIVGADVVEVSPAYDCSEITALAAASIAIEICYLWAKYKKSSK